MPKDEYGDPPEPGAPAEQVEFEGAAVRGPDREAEQRRFHARAQSLAVMAAENQRLRERVLALEHDREQLRDDLAGLRSEQTHERRLASALTSENQGYAARLASLERHSADLANLYVASHQLHATLDREAVLVAIQEIVANLIGCEEMAVFELAPGGAWLELVAVNGRVPAGLERVPLPATGVIGHVVASGQTWVRAAATDAALPDEAAFIACIPLRLDDQAVGAIAIFALLPQKAGLEPLDHELFELLAAQAGLALYRAGLQARLVPPDSSPALRGV